MEQPRPRPIRHGLIALAAALAAAPAFATASVPAPATVAVTPADAQQMLHAVNGAASEQLTLTLGCVRSGTRMVC